LAEQVGDELARRHRSAVLSVTTMLALTALLVVLAYTGVLPRLPGILHNPIVYGALWISILFCGLGAIAVRRAHFNAVRLETIASLRGTRGLLATLQRTTTLVALIGGLVAVLGYLLTLLTYDTTNMRNAAIIAVAVLFYCYPRRAAWQRVVAATQQPGGLTTPTPPAKGTPA
jgi:hypothetical protein